MLTEMNLTDVHLKFNAHTPLDTWSNKSHKSRIDYIFVNEGLLGSIDLHEVLNIEEILETDHKALTINIHFKEYIRDDKHW
jgi:endonuclease/exonuclease/phosphatase family metal-dependent hydrolase